MMQVQDLQDTVGDEAFGRKTLPLVFGDGASQVRADGSSMMHHHTHTTPIPLNLRRSFTTDHCIRPLNYTIVVDPKYLKIDRYESEERRGAAISEQRPTLPL